MSEFDYQNKLNDLRADLNAVEGFTVCDSYHKLVNNMPMSSGMRGIELSSLRNFLRNCGFYADIGDTDAILRRFDYNGDTRLDYNEFYELVTGNEYVEKASPKEAEEEEKEDKPLEVAELDGED
jgi:hypothetical protein